MNPSDDSEAGPAFPPPELLARLKTVLPEDRLDAFLHDSTERRRPTIRVNTICSDIDTVRGELEEAGIKTTPVEWCPDALRCDADSRSLQETPSWRSGSFHIQSLSSMATAPMLQPEPGERILDMCAAPGSKTSHIAALMRNEGTLVANDLSRSRMHRMRAILDQLGARVTTRLGPGEQIGHREPDSFDRVLLDAPCSGEGMMKSDDPKTWSGWRPNTSKRLGSRQKSLLHSAIDAVRPGGVVVYSTCTFAPEENELVLQRAMKRYEGRIELEPLPLEIPGSLDPIESWNDKALPDLRHARRLAPPGMDGFFIARLRRLV
ncbi:MAG: RsmB/NOP family class I SAM-dependent RNA methyltransferase [Phycisphaerales bacterium]|nr:RsmB/NOP family class I SAM-dependent RNA methyltransferase [Phycisphaerales bacterium]